MNDPRRLSQSGGISQRLLDSASLDKPSEAAKRRAEMFAGTASSFSSTTSHVSLKRHRGSTAKTLVTWIGIGAAASAALAFGGSRLLQSGESSPAAAASGAPMAELPAAAPVAPTRPSDISPEPAVHIAPTPAPPVKPLGSIVPWVPSPVASAAPPLPPAAPTPSRPSSASFDEAREIEAAREAVSRGDNSGAIATLNQYDQSHPAGALKAESTVLRVQALSNSGKTSEARQLADEFSGKNPTHPLTEQLRALGR